MPDGRESNTLEGILQVRHGALDIRDHKGQTYRIPVAHLEVREGGMNNRFIFFTHPSHPGFCCYTEDQSILHDPVIADLPELKTMRRKGIKRKSAWIFFLLIPLFITGLLITLLLGLRGKVSEYLADKIPPSEEREIGKHLKQEMLTGKTVLDDSVFLAMLKPVTGRLKLALNDTHFRFEYSVIKDSAMNAFALPGGFVVIHTGLIEAAGTPEEIAGVLAHEISHVTARHHVRGLIGNLGLFLVLQGLLGDIAGIGGSLVEAGSQLGSLKYSRDYEREADERGAELLMRAEIDPSGLITFFDKLEKKHAKGQEVPAWMSTHPELKERKENLRKLRKEGTSYRPVEISLPELQQRMKALMN